MIDWKSTEILVVAHAIILIVFSSIYKTMDFTKHFTVDKPLTGVHPIYYAVTVSSSTGFGDITPRTTIARVITTLHMLLAWGTTILVIARYRLA